MRGGGVASCKNLGAGGLDERVKGLEWKKRAGFGGALGIRLPCSDPDAIFTGRSRLGAEALSENVRAR
jgi:hypothetical protein